MDAPWKWAGGWTCVDNGERVVLEDNSGDPLPDDVDVYKAAIFWYDKRHENGLAIDDIDLHLERVRDQWDLANSIDSNDNKERIYYTDPGGMAVQIVIHGFDVTADDTVCGTNSQKVYYSWFYEDSDRDDSDGPSSARIAPE